MWRSTAAAAAHTARAQAGPLSRRCATVNDDAKAVVALACTGLLESGSLVPIGTKELKCNNADSSAADMLLRRL